MPIRGTTQRLVGLFYNETTGALTNPTSVSLSILLGSTVIATVASPAIVHDATGTYHYDWAIPHDAAAGVYVVAWDTVMAGDTAHSFGYESVDVTLTAVTPGSGCDWPIDVGCLGDAWDGYSTEVKDRAVRLASATLSRLCAYRVGDCPITVRPAPQNGSCWFGADVSTSLPFRPVFWAGSAYNLWQGACGSPCEVELPAPVVEVREVKVDGTVLDPADYRVDNSHLLVWQGAGDCPFLASQNMALPDTEPGTFSVTYLNSYKVDSNGAYAAGLLASEYAKACAGGKCRLPGNISSIVRSGVSFEVVSGAFPNGLTGIREIDAYVALWNPKGRPAQFLFDPGAPRHRVVTS